MNLEEDVGKQLLQLISGATEEPNALTDASSVVPPDRTVEAVHFGAADAPSFNAEESADNGQIGNEVSLKNSVMDVVEESLDI